MSSCDAYMVSSSGLFTQNVYRRFWVKDRDEAHYVLVGRIASLFIVVGGLAFAFAVEDVPSGLEIFWKFTAMMAAAFWLGLFWRRTTEAGAWAGTIVAFGVLIVTNQVWFDKWAVEHLPQFMIWNNQFRVSWQMFSYLIAGFGTCILVSLCTPRSPEAKLNRFFACIHTPVDDEEPHSTEPFTLSEGVEPIAPKKLINLPNLEIPKPSMTDLIGFAFFWLMVVLMIAFVHWLANRGA
jgi:Na+/proline symporter